MITVLRVALAELRRHPGRALLPGIALLIGPACPIALADASGRPVDVVVSGITVRGAPHGETSLVLGPDLVQRLGAEAKTSRLDLVLAPGADPGTVARAVRAALGPDMTVTDA